MSGNLNNMNSGRPLPYNSETEKTVLGACLLSEDAVADLVAELHPNNFFRPAHRIIFERMCNMFNRNIPVDPISLADELERNNELEKIGGQSYILELSDNTLSLTNWKHHSDIVKKDSVLRAIIQASFDINSIAYDSADDLSSIVEQSERALFKATQQRISSSFKGMNELVENTFNEINEMVANPDKCHGVQTGFLDVDNLFGGFRGGDLVILAARPAIGKTAFALNMATRAARGGATVAFLSLEMSAIQLMQRVLCSEAKVELQSVRKGRVKETDWEPLVAASSELSKLDFFIDDTPSLSINELRAKARRELRGVENGLIIVDYLQLMQPSIARRDGNRAVEVAEISRGLKILAKEMNMPIIALSQLNRVVEIRKNKQPMLSDLRESGSIEQDADIVMFLDRSVTPEEAEEDGRPNPGEAKLLVAKHRNGQTGVIGLSFEQRFTRFGDLARGSEYYA
ncbi:MAG: replicative DNA helicase [Eggerthellaceae bacterium]|nr:replicative DNA helicase [Eggerthellaceae bacterium]